MKTMKKVLSVIAVVALICLTMTGCATTGDASAGASSLVSLLPFVVLIVVFYFFLIRPENKKKKELSKMRDELSVGDEITTIGGMVGKVVHVKDNLITFETGEDRVRIQVTKWAISTKGKAETQN